MDAAATQSVLQRAGNRCEYCRLPQLYSGLRFHIEHIIARQHGGSDDSENLALACPECNYHKGTNLAGIDPDTGQLIPLFNPRKEKWQDHFSQVEATVVGKTPTGRTTAWLLEMNSGNRLALRKSLLRLGLLD